MQGNGSGTSTPPSSKDSLIHDLRAALLKTTPNASANNLAAEKLIMKTAEISSNFSSLESKFKFLRDSTKDSWFSWREKYLIYRKKFGSREIIDLWEQDTIVAYQDLLDKDLSSLTSDNLFLMIDEFHGTSSTGWVLLKENLKMDKSKKYNRKNIEIYIQQLSVILNRLSQIEEECNEEVIVDHFFSQIQPE